MIALSLLMLVMSTAFGMGIGKTTSVTPAPAVTYVADLPRPLFREYDKRSATSGAGGAKKEAVTVESCAKLGYPTVLLLTSSMGEGLQFAFGSAGSALGPNLKFYHETRTCQRVDVASVRRPVDAVVPASVTKEFEKLTQQKPKLLVVSKLICQKGKGAPVFDVSWSTGYVGGRTFFDINGNNLGSNSGDDTGGRSQGFDDSGYVCDLI